MLDLDPASFTHVPHNVALTLPSDHHQSRIIVFAFVASFLVQHLSTVLFQRRCRSLWNSLDGNNRADIAIRCVIGVWGLLSSVWASVVLTPALRNGTSIAERMYATETSGLLNAEALCSAAVGFFAWDIVTSLWLYEEYGSAFLLHAVASFAAFAIPKCMPRGFLLYYGCVFLVWEVTAPFLGARTLLIKMKKTDSVAFSIIERCGFALFIVIRFVFGLPAMIMYVSDAYAMRWLGLAKPTSVYATFTFAAVLFPLMNCMWVGKMIKALMRSKNRSKSA